MIKFAPEAAALVGWIWHPGYQSHYVTDNGVHIPTCNVYLPNIKCKADMYKAEINQLAIIARHKIQRMR